MKKTAMIAWRWLMLVPWLACGCIPPMIFPPPPDAPVGSPPTSRHAGSGEGEDPQASLDTLSDDEEGMGDSGDFFFRMSFPTDTMDFGGADPAAMQEIFADLQSADLELRRAAMDVMGSLRLGGGQFATMLAHISRHDPDPIVRQKAADSLQRMSRNRASRAGDTRAGDPPERRASSAGAVEPAPPEPVAVARTSNEPPQIVAVIEVQDASGKIGKNVLAQLTTYLGTALTRSGRYQTVPQERMRQTMREQKKNSYDHVMDEASQIELGKAVAAQKMLSTQILNVGRRCAVTANLYDLKKETAERAALSNSGCTDEELLSAMQEIAAQLAR
mgnify:CR=1 FL=1